MSKSWPEYFGVHEPWARCNVRGDSSRNSRKRIRKFIDQLQSDGFRSEGRRKRSLTGSTSEEVLKLQKRRKLANDRSKRKYWKSKIDDDVPESERVELALSVLEDYCAGARTWFTKAIPNLKEVHHQYCLSKVKFHSNVNFNKKNVKLSTRVYFQYI